MALQFTADLNQWDGLKTDLAVILAEFRDADVHAETTANATGHKKLAKRVTEFSSTWSIKREEVVSNLEMLQAMIEGIQEAFTGIDQDLADALDGKQKSEPEVIP